ncbi:MAG TPA: site-2 protease family protein [Anaeromyxobacter sp.]|nr:site-2 protease family protein [Anaeromyxobacter sp.]
MEAVFRPALRNLLPALLAGALGGLLVGGVADVPLPLGALFGAIAAAIAIGVRQLTGVRIVATEAGLSVKGGGAPVEARWGELRIGFGRTPRADGSLQRYAILADARGRSFAFAERAGVGPCAPVRGLDGDEVEVVDLRDAALLLALVVQRTPAWWILPPALQGLALEPVNAPEPAPGLSGAATTAASANPGRPRVGLLGLATKLLGTIAKAAKTTSVAWAAVSAAAWGVLFSWKFAAALLIQLFVHEYGHVHAMRRTGMRVRGLYLVPFLGALAVTDDAFTSRRQQAYVALNGPFWGALFSLVPAGLWLWTRDPLWAAVATWWAVINLFNLLPIAPLDGGRVMQAFAYSYSSTLGVALTVLGLGGAVAVGTAFGYELVWMIAALGALELLAESQARAGGRALRLLPERTRFGPAHFAWLRGVLGPPASPQSDALLARELARMEHAARAAPLRGPELVAWGLGYAALAAALLALVAFMSHVPGATIAAQLLS